MWMKYEWIRIGFIQQNTAISVMMEWLHKGHHQTTLHNKLIPKLKVLQEKLLE